MMTGSMVALVTPMNDDGSINYEQLDGLISFHIDAGTTCLVIAGTTGESATLSHAEHIELIARSIELAKGRIPIIAGTGSNSTAQTLGLSKEVDSLDVAGLLLVAPYYNKPPQRGMIRHFSTIADAVSAPIILYNVPARTASDMLPETVVELSCHENIVGIKEATGDLDRLKAIQGNTEDDFSLLSGDDETSCEFMLRGGHGVISVTANVAPKKMRDLCDAATSGDRVTADAIDAELQLLHSNLFLESNPIPVKWAVHRMGYMGSAIRSPLVELDLVHRDALYEAMDRASVDYSK